MPHRHCSSALKLECFSLHFTVIIWLYVNNVIFRTCLDKKKCFYNIWNNGQSIKAQKNKTPHLMKVHSILSTVCSPCELLLIRSLFSFPPNIFLGSLFLNEDLMKAESRLLIRATVYKDDKVSRSIILILLEGVSDAHITDIC